MLNKIKKIRESSGAGIVEIKKALIEADGNEEKALGILRKKGSSKAAKKMGRKTYEGVIVSYVHSNKRVGAIVKLLCETDFVARNEEFENLARDIAMHITAMNPQYIKPEDVALDLISKEREIWTEQLKNEKKPKEIIDKILAGKEQKFRQDISLITQPSVKDHEITVGDLLTEKIFKIGENIQIDDFSRMEL